ncbi:hypothetical protein A5724_32605 [Mycobacterium sp. ACS1612]|uniref:divisome protein SepX/GlpR n=1 Tax=Mycobacterium sp. ACS1612 TaxID=1834117 RepID=UPI0007FDA266|nr:gephyrin-like molybdotransferase receptor GlpR [Mycobacterium sp. ACS1612]OBF26040.1 hypothetical protein A5724_32605 [Mycobacterium sp. ACS1612]
MPSIPQSLLWISLVVLWLFVLVPMLISKRDAVRRTSDVALATRVLNTSRGARLLRRGRPAAGHNSDPDWQPSEDDDDLDDEMHEESKERAVVRAAVVESEIDSEPDYLDVDIVDEDSGALPVGESANEVVEAATAPEQADELPLEFAEEPEAEELEAEVPAAEYEPESDGTADEYEYVDDSSGLEAPSETDLQIAESISAARRRRSEARAASIDARKYKFRKRMLTALTLAIIVAAAAAIALTPVAWYACGSLSAITILYLAYLRRQTRIEERLRRRRAQRIARSRLGVENTDDREFDVVPSRLRRPGSVVLEIDDEDPIFEHLDYAPFARDFDLPRAAGQ